MEDLGLRPSTRCRDEWPFLQAFVPHLILITSVSEKCYQANYYTPMGTRTPNRRAIHRAACIGNGSLGNASRVFNKNSSTSTVTRGQSATIVRGRL